MMMAILRSLLSGDGKRQVKDEDLHEAVSIADEKALLLSDNPALTVSARKVLVDQGFDCPPQATGTYGNGSALAKELGPKLIILFLCQDQKRGFDLLTELCGLTSARIFCVGPTKDPQLILQVLRLGVDDYLDENKVEEDLQAALSSRKSVRDRPFPRGKIIAILSPSGGGGGTTLAANLGLALALKQQRSLLIDLDLAKGDLASFLDLKPRFTFADLCKHGEAIDRKMLERSLARHEKGVYLLGSLSQQPASSKNVVEMAHHILDLVRVNFSHVIVDYSSFSTPEEEILRNADLLYLVMRLDFVSVKNARRTLKKIEKLNVPKDRLQVIVNRFGQPGELAVAKTEEALGVKFAHFIPDDPKLLNRAVNQGTPVVLGNPKSKVAQSFFSLANGVLTAKLANTPEN